MNIFDFMYEPLKFDKNKPLKLFEAFSGIGTQSMALKRLGVDLEIIGISEIDKYALQSYQAIHGDVKNYGGIGDFKRFPKGIDIATWSFPCQDISLAGKQVGMIEGSRSNYGYVFLDTVKNTPYEERPKVLLMENVKALFSETFKEDWREIQLRLENMGYHNYAEILNAKDYGVAQNRERVFIVSVLGDYVYNFPKPFKLVKKLKDYLENEVDEKYYLSDKLIQEILYDVDEKVKVPQIGYAIAKDGDGIYINRPHQKRGVVQNGKIQTIKTSVDDIGVVVKDKRNLKEKLADDLIKNNIVENGDVINHSYTNQARKQNSRLKLEDYIETKSGIMPTLTTRPDVLGVVVKTNNDDVLIYKTKKNDMPRDRIYDTSSKYLFTITTNSNQQPFIYNSTKKYSKKSIEKITNNNDLRIRKLTPLECWRLMGIDDEDFYKAQASGISNSQLYKQAGNAIVVDVLYYIFKEMF